MRPRLQTWKRGSIVNGVSIIEFAAVLQFCRTVLTLAVLILSLMTVLNPEKLAALTYDGVDIAFTAFLDHDINHIGADQVIVFDNVLLNDGNGYNQNTGVFTVPVSGVYHFDFFIGERDINQMYVRLLVNNVAQIDAVAESIEDAHDTQGGNAANLKMMQGDVVYIKHNTWGSHIEGSSDVRISSFSGFLLYPVQSSPIVGK